ncbi:hypothetical protein KAR91_44380 [Candidatus Pacearchaeota archaeon]|nr:hypothetical protein [Candidatus Pacearchaeota archaeon]
MKQGMSNRDADRLDTKIKEVILLVHEIAKRNSDKNEAPFLINAYGLMSEVTSQILSKNHEVIMKAVRETSESMKSQETQVQDNKEKEAQN